VGLCLKHVGAALLWLWTHDLCAVDLHPGNIIRHRDRLLLIDCLVSKMDTTVAVNELVMRKHFATVKQDRIPTRQTDAAALALVVCWIVDHKKFRTSLTLLSQTQDAGPLAGTQSPKLLLRTLAQRYAGDDKTVSTLLTTLGV